MPLVDDTDVQTHLPIDKLRVEAIPDDKAAAYEDAERIIRGHLAGVFQAATLASWLTPDDTPPEIRAVGGRLAAAKIYRVRYSENSLEDPEYAQALYNEAMSMLMSIIQGDITLTDVDDDIGLVFDSSYFEPNNASAPPIFTMDGRF